MTTSRMATAMSSSFLTSSSASCPECACRKWSGRPSMRDVPHREDSRVRNAGIVVDDQDVPGFPLASSFVPDAVREVVEDVQAVVRRVAGHCGRGGCRGLCRRRCQEHWVLSGHFNHKRRSCANAAFHRNSPAEDAGHDVVTMFSPSPLPPWPSLVVKKGRRCGGRILRECRCRHR